MNINAERIEKVLNKIYSLLAGDLKSPTEVSNEHDELDAIMVGLNMLGEHIQATMVSKDKYQHEFERAETSLKIKDTFVSNLSHEIRTPLNAILGFVSLMKLTRLDANQQDYVSNFENAGRYLLDIVNELLDYQKLNAGKFVIETTTFNLSQAILDVVRLHTARSNEKNIEIINYFQPSEGLSIANDVSLLRQILNNLISNAIKFTDHGWIVVHTSLFDRKEQTYCKIMVKDSGIGLPENPERLLNLFEQADNSTTRKYGGTGLGLSIVKKNIELLQGTIKLYNDPSVKGAVFEFEFPTEIAYINKPDDLFYKAFENYRVLIVDDIEWNRRLLHEYITQWKMRNGAFSDALTAISALKLAKSQADPYRIALLDYQMAGIDGLALAKMIKADKEISDIHIFIISSSPISLEVQKQHPEVSGFALKPISKSDLLNLLFWVFHKRPLKEKSLTEQAMPVATHGKVLIAEDNTVNQKLLEKMLSIIGYETLIANNGKEAIEYCRIFQDIKYVFMDIQMPVIDGIEAMQKLKNGICSSKMVVAVTANDMPGDKEKYLSMGFDHYLSKPISFEALKSFFITERA